MTTREDFEKWFAGLQAEHKEELDEIPLVGVWAAKGFMAGHKACAAHYEAELLKRDALIAEQRKAALDYLEMTDKESWLQNDFALRVNLIKAISLTHDSVRLKKVSTVNSVAKGYASWLVVSDTVQEPVGVERGTKLYTIVKGAEG